MVIKINNAIIFILFLTSCSRFIFHDENENITPRLKVFMNEKDFKVLSKYIDSSKINVMGQIHYQYVFDVGTKEVKFSVKDKVNKIALSKKYTFVYYPLFNEKSKKGFVFNQSDTLIEDM